LESADRRSGRALIENLDKETRMETRIYPNSPEPDETPAVAAVGEVVEHAGAERAEVVADPTAHLGAAWSFTRHLLEMVVAMMARMVVLGVALEVLGEPRGYGNALVEYGLMAWR
jgi:hypothetical protein